MNTLINVNPETLEEVAGRVEMANGDYGRLFRNLYEEVDKLALNWVGKDNIAFTNRIKTYEEDFRQISLIISQYAEFLKASARSYREIQEELTNSANRLRV